MSNTNSSIFEDWFVSPNTEHVVQFYRSGKELVGTLSQYIGSGLRIGDTCIVIATRDHISKLNKQLEEMTDLEVAIRSGQYQTFDADETLAQFMRDGVPDEGLFLKHVGNAISDATTTGKPIRAYGEMVARLWKGGNEAGVMALETLWNRLALTHEFSLYCAYPDMHFIMDAEAKQNIHACHTSNFLPAHA